LKNNPASGSRSAKIPEIIEAPDLLNIQLESWESFLQADTGRARGGTRPSVGVQNELPDHRREGEFSPGNSSSTMSRTEVLGPRVRERGLTYAVPIKRSCACPRRQRTGIVRETRSNRTSIWGPADDDAPRDLHHQRGGACGRQPAPPVSGCVLQ